MKYNKLTKLIFIPISLMLMQTFIFTADRNGKKEAVILNRLISTALSNNYKLRALESDYKRAQKSIFPGYLPPDPVLSYSLANLPVVNPSLKGSAMSAEKINISQMIPSIPLLAIKGTIRKNTADLLKIQYLLFRDKVIRDIKVKYYEIRYLNRVIKIENEKKKQLSVFEELAGTKYRLGKGLQQDFLKAKINLSSIDKKLILLKTKKDIAINKIIQLSGLNHLPEYMNFDNTENLLMEFNDALILKKVEENFYGISLAKIRLNISESLIKLKKWQSFPALMLGATYSIRSDELPDNGVDFLTFSAGINLPIFSSIKTPAELQSAKFQNQKLKFLLNDIQAQTITKVNNHLLLYRQSREIFSLYKNDIIKQAETELDSTLSAYQVDKVDFLNVIQSLINLYSFRVETEDAEKELFIHKAHIEYYLSGSLNIKK